ncbi:Hypothetical protein SMAX5B_021756 [Scophthalmus maximus]|uniref:Uncharacterized protein n=1 Tax=Scophthalmus maximus TaxID=52904 RepID=A0A2U9CZI2_SCOMX|nr:Hypothetical protein SMAX5B_021756 [Scophthalmus maximus]
MPGTAGLQDYRKPPAHRSYHLHGKFGLKGSPLAGPAEILTLCITKNTHKIPGIPVEARCDTFFNQCLQKRDKGTPSCLIDRRLLFLRRPDNSPAVNDCVHSPGHRSCARNATRHARPRRMTFLHTRTLPQESQ